MWWLASTAPARLTPPGEATMRCPGRPAFLTNEPNNRERWRS